MKQLLLGFAFLLFSVAMSFLEFNEYGPWIPILDVLPYDYISLISAIVGIVLAIVGACRKDNSKQ